MTVHDFFGADGEYVQAGIGGSRILEGVCRGYAMEDLVCRLTMARMLIIFNTTRDVLSFHG